VQRKRHNDEARMSNDKGSANDEARMRLDRRRLFFVIRASTLIRHSSFGFCHYSETTFGRRGFDPPAVHLLDVAGFGAGSCASDSTLADFSGANGLTNASSKS
jgi:hypothetical protein